MTTITNISEITDYSGEAPVTTPSNPVTTIIRQTPFEPIVTRVFYRLPCNCCDCCCNCCCNRCRNMNH